MTPHTTGLYKTLHLLVMLFRANKQQLPKPKPEEQATIRISRQILSDAGLTVPELANYLLWLAERHYLEGVVVFDETYRKILKKEMDGEAGKKIQSAFRKYDREDSSGKTKQVLVQHIKAKLPRDMEIDEEEINASSVGLADLSDDGFQLFKRLRSDEIALFVLFPFKDIERLLERIGDGEDPKKIKDDGTWYDSDKHIFYIGENAIQVSHQGKANIEHYVLTHFEKAKKTGKIWFDDIDGFRPDSLRSAMYKFLKKDVRLEDLFSVHSDRIEVFTGRTY